MIYLAAPYTHRNTGVRNARVEATAHAVHIAMHSPERALFTQRKWIYSPILHGHYVEHCLGHTVSYELWLAHGLDALHACDEFAVLELPGWEDSKGVEWETVEAIHASKLRHQWKWQDFRQLLSPELIARLEDI